NNLIAARSPNFALTINSPATMRISASVTVSNSTARSCATRRAKGLPGPPLLPAEKRPWASRPALSAVGGCAEGVGVGAVRGLDWLMTTSKEMGMGTAGTLATPYYPKKDVLLTELICRKMSDNGGQSLNGVQRLDVRTATARILRQ